MTDQFNASYLHDSAISIFDRLQVPATAYSVSAHLLDDRPRPSARRIGDSSLPVHISCTPVFLDVIDRSHCMNFESCISTIKHNVDINYIYVLLLRSEDINDASIKQLLLFYFQYVEPCRNNNVMHKNTSWTLVLDKILNDPVLYEALLKDVFRRRSLTYRDYHELVGNIVGEDTVRKYIRKNIYNKDAVHAESNHTPYQDSGIVYIGSNIPQNQSINVFDKHNEQSHHQSKQQDHEAENDVEDLSTDDPFERGRLLFDKIKNELDPNIRDCYDLVNNGNWTNENHRLTFIERIKQYSDNETEMHSFIDKFISEMQKRGESWIYG